MTTIRFSKICEEFRRFNLPTEAFEKLLARRGFLGQPVAGLKELSFDEAVLPAVALDAAELAELVAGSEPGKDERIERFAAARPVGFSVEALAAYFGKAQDVATLARLLERRGVEVNAGGRFTELDAALLRELAGDLRELAALGGEFSRRSFLAFVPGVTVRQFQEEIVLQAANTATEATAVRNVFARILATAKIPVYGGRIPTRCVGAQGRMRAGRLAFQVARSAVNRKELEQVLAGLQQTAAAAPEAAAV